MVVEEFLLDLGISPDLKGFKYIRDFLETKFPNDTFKLTDCYRHLASIYDVSPASVERAIRHAIETTYPRFSEKHRKQIFGNISIKHDKPTNKTFLCCLQLRYDKLNLKETHE